MDGPCLEARPKTLLLVLLIVILCLCDCEAGKKKKHCKYNGKKYRPGEGIVALEDNCVEIKCSKLGKNTELGLMKNCVCGPQATFVGPYNNIWNDNQCPNILNYFKPKSLSDCQFKCEDTSDCTAINFKEDICVLRACTLPVPQPQWDYPPWKGYKIYEGKQEEITNTTMYFMYNANITLNEKAAKKKKPCKYNSKKYIPGKVIETLDDNCVELKCSRKGKNTVLELIKNCVCGTEECTPKCQNGGLCSAYSICQCPEGWSGDACDQIDCGSPWVSIGNNKECYLFGQIHLNWDSARSFCSREGGDLAILDTDDKRRYVVNYMESRGFRNGFFPHLGANDRAGFWHWLNGEIVTSGWRRLNVAQPDDDRGHDTCMYLYTDPYPSGRYDLLSDWKCTAEKHFICEKNATANVQKIEVYNVIYETDIARILSHPGSSKVTTIINNSNTPQTTTTVITVSYEHTRKWEFSLALALGISAEFKAGLPLIAESSITVSALVTTTATVGGTYTKTEEHQVRASIEVPANSRITAWVRYNKYKVDIPYTALLKKYYVDGSTKIVSVSGVFKGVDAAEFVVVYGETESMI